MSQGLFQKTGPVAQLREPSDRTQSALQQLSVSIGSLRELYNDGLKAVQDTISTNTPNFS